MNRTKLYRQWLQEEDAARMKGWDFSHLRGRYEEEQDLPWDYEQVVLAFLRPDKELLDMDTGGGEFLLSLGHPRNKTSATEGWPPDADICRQRLAPLGIRFQQVDGGGPLPFADGAFDLILNRHGSYGPAEVYRLLRPGGKFITEQVGAQNDRELVELLLGELPLPFPRQTLACAAGEAENAGLRVLRGEEAFRPIRFWDVGALMWFARVLPWEFPGFSVDACQEQLYCAQEILERNGVIAGTIHRYLMVLQKKNLKPQIMQVVIPPHRDLIKTSETVENKGFFALCSPYPFIRFHTVLPLLREVIRAKARAGKTDNTI